jgi:hypothetical protein
MAPQLAVSWEPHLVGLLERRKVGWSEMTWVERRAEQLVDLLEHQKVGSMVANWVEMLGFLMVEMWVVQRAGLWADWMADSWGIQMVD